VVEVEALDEVDEASSEESSSDSSADDTPLVEAPAM
jgi:hypothetical protein